MYCRTISGVLSGIYGKLIKVEVDISNGMPKFEIVGMPGHSVRESKDRVRTSLKNIDKQLPYKRITINLAPASLRKDGSGFDLAIAAGVLSCMEVLDPAITEESFFIGELSLCGEVMSCKGVLAFVQTCKKEGVKRCFVPWINYNEARLVEGVEIIPVRDLCHLICIIKKLKEGKYIQEEIKEEIFEDPYAQYVDFSQVIGQKQGKRGLEIAVSGMHHILLKGPPGVGKTMLAKRIKTILPALKKEEIIELTQIYSAADKIVEQKNIIKQRPYREPHHSITRASFLGGGMQVKPGEISLAHKGVLMLDEFPEFKRDVIEALREPMESGEIVLGRNQTIYNFPCKFMLVASMNPCPCGHYPDKNKCTCLPKEVDHYQQKISGPIMDRIDMHITLRAIAIDELVDKGDEEPSKTVLERVKVCHEIQGKRFIDENIHYNSEMSANQIDKYCIMTEQAKKIAKDSYERLGMSTRSYHRMLKVARTIADMDGDNFIDIKHIAEAIIFREGT